MNRLMKYVFTKREKFLLVVLVVLALGAVWYCGIYAPLEARIRAADTTDLEDEISLEQIKAQIISGELKENDILPSVRGMAKELKISALTVKKAYDNLEEEGMTVTVHGKGTYVAASNTQLMEEERRKEVEADLEAAVQKGRRCGMKEEEIRALFELIMEDEVC